MAYLKGAYAFYSLKTADIFRERLKTEISEKIKSYSPIRNIALNYYVVGVSYKGENDKLIATKEKIEKLYKDVIEEHRKEYIKWNEQFK